MTDLSGKVALITGAGSGIGAASAVALAGAGSRVVCADIDAHAASRTAGAIADAGGAAIPVQADIASQAANDAVVQAALDEFGRLDIAHLNAGLGVMQAILDITPDAWQRTFAVNVTGTMFGLQAAGRAMVAGGGGSIVVTSSAAGLRGVRASAAYSASKHAAIGLARSAALDLAPRGVRVNAICPGIIDTALLDPLRDHAPVLDRMTAMHPLGRLGTADEVARLVLFLASDAASFITGSVYSIDGGLSAGS